MTERNSILISLDEISFSKLFKRSQSAKKPEKKVTVLKNAGLVAKLAKQKKPVKKQPQARIVSVGKKKEKLPTQMVIKNLNKFKIKQPVNRHDSSKLSKLSENSLFGGKSKGSEFGSFLGVSNDESMMDEEMAKIKRKLKNLK